MKPGRILTWFSVSIVVTLLIFVAVGAAAATAAKSDTPVAQPDTHASPEAAQVGSSDASTSHTATGKAADDLSWHSVDGGGGTSINGSLRLTGAIGQSESGLSARGTETLVGGLWASPQTSHLFSDSFEGGDALGWNNASP